MSPDRRILVPRSWLIIGMLGWIGVGTLTILLLTKPSAPIATSMAPTTTLITGLPGTTGRLGIPYESHILALPFLECEIRVYYSSTELAGGTRTPTGIGIARLSPEARRSLVQPLARPRQTIPVPITATSTLMTPTATRTIPSPTPHVTTTPTETPLPSATASMTILLPPTRRPPTIIPTPRPASTNTPAPSLPPPTETPTPVPPTIEPTAIPIEPTAVPVEPTEVPIEPTAVPPTPRPWETPEPWICPPKCN